MPFILVCLTQLSNTSDSIGTLRSLLIVFYVIKMYSPTTGIVLLTTYTCNLSANLNVIMQ